MTRHPAPFDALILGVTVVSVVPLAIVAGVFGRRALAAPGHVLDVAVLVATAGLVLGSWGTSPTAYRVEPGRLVVERPVGEIVYPLTGLVDVEPFQRWGFTIRVGNGGLFGVTGWFWNRTLGWFRVHGRKACGAVLLRWPDHAAVVMPEDPARFIDDVGRFR